MNIFTKTICVYIICVTPTIQISYNTYMDEILPNNNKKIHNYLHKILIIMKKCRIFLTFNKIKHTQKLVLFYCHFWLLTSDINSDQYRITILNITYWNSVYTVSKLCFIQKGDVVGWHQSWRLYFPESYYFRCIFIK